MKFGVPIRFDELPPGYHFTVPNSTDIWYKGHQANVQAKRNRDDKDWYPDRKFLPEETVIPMETGTYRSAQMWDADLTQEELIEFLTEIP